MTTERETIINNYVSGYNQSDIDKMVADFDNDIQFKNVHQGQITMSLIGLFAFKQQAEEAKNYFTQRAQTIKSFHHTEKSTEIDIDYTAVLAVDLPNGLKKGQTLNLTGKSIFEFDGDKVIGLTDIS